MTGVTGSDCRIARLRAIVIEEIHTHSHLIIDFRDKQSFDSLLGGARNANSTVVCMVSRIA